MRLRRLTLLVFLSIFALATFLYGCFALEQSFRTTYVDAVNGSDLDGNGSEANPYKTLSHAISLREKFRIKMAAGTYSSDSGEVFPLLIYSNLEISGDTDSPEQAVITGGGMLGEEYGNVNTPVAVVLEDGAQLRYLTISSPGGIAIWNQEGDARTLIHDSIISGSEFGLVVVDQGAPVIYQTSITNNAMGVELLDSSAPTFVRSEISENDIGFTINDSALPNFNYYTSGSDNAIRANISCDFLHQGGMDIAMTNLQWDEDVFDFTIGTTCSDGANIVVQGTGSIDYQFIPSETSPVFPGRELISINSPSFGEVIPSPEPGFSWIPHSSNTMFMVVMDQQPTLSGSRIVNVDHIVWIWHPGLGSSTPGSISFNQGKALEGHDVEKDITDPVPLERGRSYYWAVWEWNSDNSDIVSSSAINYFRVSPE